MPTTKTQTTSLSLYGSILKTLEAEKPKDPPPRPQVMLDYDRLSHHAKKSVGQDFWQSDEVVSYIDLKWKLELENATAYQWLLEIRKTAAPNDMETRRRVGAKITEYAVFFKKHKLTMFPAFSSMLMYFEFEKELVGQPEVKSLQKDDVSWDE